MTIDKIYKKQKFLFILSICTSIILFVGIVLYTAKQVVIPNIALERWSIILTLGGIFASLKLLHPKLKAEDKTNDSIALKKYNNRYVIRLMIIMGIFSFNLASLYFTGIKNFTYMAFITIFAILLCAPNKKHLMNEISNSEPNNESEN